VGAAVEQWMRDRDLLVEETLAFVQGVATNKPAWIETPTQVEQPKTVASEQIAKSRDRLFDREEIWQRVADFKAKQHKFQRGREEYYKETMAKVRSSSSDV
jgi:cytochrome c556